VNERDELEARIQRHYAGRSLDDEALARLREQLPAEAAEPAEATPPARRRRRPFVALLGVAAVVGLAAGVALGLTRWIDPGEGRRQTRRLADEIALNHTEQLQLEFVERDFESLSQVMPKLGFALRPPGRLEGDPYEILGARYATVGGQMAAQVRLVDRQGRYVTVFELEPGEEWAEVEALEGKVEFVQVEVWRQDGLIVGMARFEDVVID